MDDQHPDGCQAVTYIEEACVRHTRADLAVEAGRDWTLCRGKLIGCNLDRRVVWVSYPEPVWKSMTVKVVPGSRIGFRFPSRDRRVSFLGTMLKKGQMRRGLGANGAIEVAVPERIACENMRKSYRVPIDPNAPFRIVLWDSDMRALTNPSDAPTMYSARVADLSIGGAAVTDFDADPGWGVEAHVGCELQPPEEEPLLLMAEIRRITHSKTGAATYGLAFIGAETPRKTFAAQETLAGLVSRQQREQLGHRVKTG